VRLTTGRPQRVEHVVRHSSASRRAVRGSERRPLSPRTNLRPIRRVGGRRGRPRDAPSVDGSPGSRTGFDRTGRRGRMPPECPRSGRSTLRQRAPSQHATLQADHSTPSPDRLRAHADREMNSPAGRPET
jgi:hypothetical protein